MKILVPVVLLATCVLARPDIGLDLSQKTPLSSYGVPSASVTNPPSLINSYLPPEVSPTFQTPLVSTPAPFYSTTPEPFYSSTPAPYYSSTSEPIYSSTPVPFYSPGLQYVAPSYASDILLNNGYQGISGLGALPQITSQGSFISQSSQPIYSVNNQPVEVQKHVYFFEAPEEPEEYKSYQLPIAPPKKNVKIIFIKAPSYPVPQYPVVPLQPQNEEKTLVYVLVKKPEPAELIVPTAPPTPPAKPEVYFIKYKTQKEAEDKVTNTLTQHANTGANIITNTGSLPSLPSGFDAGLTQNLITGDATGLTITDNSLLGGSLGYTTGPLLNGFGVAVTGNGITGNYISSTVPSTFISTEPTLLGSSAGFESSTISPLVSSTTLDPLLSSSTPISLGSIPVHPTYLPPISKK